MFGAVGRTKYKTTQGGRGRPNHKARFFHLLFLVGSEEALKGST